MRDLLRYSQVIYDANCIVYYCFRMDERDFNGRPVAIEGPHTRTARRITLGLTDQGKKVSTLLAAWVEAEKVTVARALDELIKEGLFAAVLGAGGQVTKALRYRFALALKTELSKLKSQNWFLIDPRSFSADRIEAVRELYRGFAMDPNNWTRIPPNKGNPSDTDIRLILFSGSTNSPLLTNDEELYNFGPELVAGGYAGFVKAFPEVRF